MRLPNHTNPLVLSLGSPESYPPIPLSSMLQTVNDEQWETTEKRMLYSCILCYWKMEKNSSVYRQVVWMNQCYKVTCTVIFVRCNGKTFYCFSQEEGCFTLLMNLEWFPPWKDWENSLQPLYTTVLSSYACDHAVLPRISVNADSSTILKYIASSKKSLNPGKHQHYSCY